MPYFRDRSDDASLPDRIVVEYYRMKVRIGSRYCLYAFESATLVARGGWFKHESGHSHSFTTSEAITLV